MQELYEQHMLELQELLEKLEIEMVLEQLETLY
jgi:hypothetical protein